MSQDGDFMRTIEGLVSIVQRASDQMLEFGDQIQIWKNAARLLELADIEKDDCLWGSHTLTKPESKELMELWSMFFGRDSDRDLGLDFDHKNQRPV